MVRFDRGQPTVHGEERVGLVGAQPVPDHLVPMSAVGVVHPGPRGEAPELLVDLHVVQGPVDNRHLVQERGLVDGATAVDGGQRGRIRPNPTRLPVVVDVVRTQLGIEVDELSRRDLS